MLQPKLSFFKTPLARSHYRPLAELVPNQALEVTLSIADQQFPPVTPPAHGVAKAFLFMTGQPQVQPNIAVFKPTEIQLTSGFNQDRLVIHVTDLTAVQVGALKARPASTTFGVAHSQAQYFQLLLLQTKQTSYYLITHSFAGLNPLATYFEQLNLGLEDPLALLPLVAQVQPAGMIAALEQTYQQRVINTGYPAEPITSLTE